MARKTLGNTTIKVLHAVATGTVYGFDIMDDTSLPSGTVYPALSRLERMGYLKTRWENQLQAQREKRPPRKYYSVTAAGKKALQEAAVMIRELQAMLPTDTAPRRARG
jgi:PadR family transcriptional regulator PadR